MVSNEGACNGLSSSIDGASLSASQYASSPQIPDVLDGIDEDAAGIERTLDKMPFHTLKCFAINTMKRLIKIRDENVQLKCQLDRQERDFARNIAARCQIYASRQMNQMAKEQKLSSQNDEEHKIRVEVEEELISMRSHCKDASDRILVLSHKLLDYENRIDASESQCETLKGKCDTLSQLVLHFQEQLGDEQHRREVADMRVLSLETTLPPCNSHHTDLAH